MINDECKPLRILHIEDSPYDAEIIRKRLSDFNSSLQIDWASNEQEFTAFLKCGSYDIILADFQLPGFDAFSALKLTKLLSSDPDIPFICVSGAIGEEKAVELLKQGATDYVLKDRIDKLPLALKRALNEVKAREAHRLAVETLRETNSYLENLIRYANVPIIVWDNSLIIMRFNFAFEKLTGKKSEDVVGHSIELLFPPDLLEYSMNLIKTTINGDRFDTVEIQIIHTDGSRKDVLWNSANIYSSDGKTLVSTIAQGFDITERKRMDEEMTSSLSLLHAALESTTDGILIVDRNGKIIKYNQKFADLCQIPQEILASRDDKTILNYALFQLVQPQKFIDRIMYLYDNPKESSSDVILLVDDRVFERYSQPQKIGDDIVGRVWSFRDITERKRAEENILRSLREKETLIRELYHRTKNTMQVIRGIIILQSEKFPMNKEVQKLVKNTDDKIQVISLVHQMLYKSQDLSKISIKEYILELAKLILKSYSILEDRISLDIKVEDESFLLDTAIPFGLILNELMTNSLKHAFPDNRKGLISISLTSDGSNNQIFKYSDNGVGVIDGFDFRTQNTLGFKLIYSIGELQMMGKVDIKNNNGISCFVEFTNKLYKARV